MVIVERKKVVEFRSLLRIVFVFLILLVVAGICFGFFRNSTQEHISLREAKNVKIAIEMLDRQYYSKGECVFAPKEYYGMTEETLKQIYELTDKKATIFLQTYDTKERRVLGFTYRNKRFEVVYKNDGKEETYKVKRRRSSR